MRIGILGAGRVGSRLGRIWSARGHDVAFGVLDPQDPRFEHLLSDIPDRVRVLDDRAAAAFGDVIVLATPWSATSAAIEAAGDLTDKILIDCTNPHKPDLSGLEFGHTISAAERIAAWAPKARVVKAFNTVSYAHLGDAESGKPPLTGFLCGDDAEAKQVVAGLVAQAGLEPLDVGPLHRARLLEPLAMLGIHLAVHQGLGGDIGIGVLRRR